MKIIAKDLYRTAAVYAEVVRETDRRYYVKAIAGYPKGPRNNAYVDKEDVIATHATPELFDALQSAERIHREALHAADVAHHKHISELKAAFAATVEQMIATEATHA